MTKQFALLKSLQELEHDSFCKDLEEI